MKSFCLRPTTTRYPQDSTRRRLLVEHSTLARGQHRLGQRAVRHSPVAPLPLRVNKRHLDVESLQLLLTPRTWQRTTQRPVVAETKYRYARAKLALHVRHQPMLLNAVFPRLSHARVEPSPLGAASMRTRCYIIVVTSPVERIVAVAWLAGSCARRHRRPSSRAYSRR